MIKQFIPFYPALWPKALPAEICLSVRVDAFQHGSLHSLEAKKLTFLIRSSYRLLPMVRIDPRWDPLRTNPRFEQMLQKYTHQAS